jgi:hypothetical protein
MRLRTALIVVAIPERRIGGPWNLLFSFFICGYLLFLVSDKKRCAFTEKVIAVLQIIY